MSGVRRYHYVDGTPVEPTASCGIIKRFYPEYACLADRVWMGEHLSASEWDKLNLLSSILSFEPVDRTQKESLKEKGA